MRVETTLSAMPSAPRAARQFVRDTLRAWHSSADIDDAELIVSELSTNAMRYDGPTMTVGVRLDDDDVVIDVTDGNSGLQGSTPSVSVPDTTAESGRGLAIVAALAASWGVTPTPHGKSVWVVLPQPVASAV
jgi:anti-sigma regulatory factor (Ser/Thr protein kinase)